MKRFGVWIVAAAIALDWASAPAAHAGESPWSLVRERDGIAVYTRPVEGSGIREFKGSALVTASVERIRALLRDADHFKDWFPEYLGVTPARPRGRRLVPVLGPRCARGP